jgi:hypothetical protein
MELTMTDQILCLRSSNDPTPEGRIFTVYADGRVDLGTEYLERLEVAARAVGLALDLDQVRLAIRTLGFLSHAPQDL